MTRVDPDLSAGRAGAGACGVADCASSPLVAAVESGGSRQFEADTRGKMHRRRIVDGGALGLAASGSALVEAGPATGVFAGTFGLPSRICGAGVAGLAPPAAAGSTPGTGYAGGGGGSSAAGASPRGDPQPAGVGGGSGLAEAEAGREQPRTQMPDDVRRIAMVKGEQMSDAELYRMVHSADRATGGGCSGSG